MLAAFIRSVLAEPRAPDPPARAWWDWVLVGALLVTAAGEAIFRADVPARPLATAVALLVIPVLLWRRSHPLLATAVGFGGAMVLHLPMIIDGVADVGLNSMAIILLLPYALYRWASGPEALVGTVIVAVPAGLGLATTEAMGDVIGGATVLVAAFALGAAMRYRAVARQREVQQVRTLERGELARELHDTVAHHVSAIAIQAQAGRAVAATDPASAVEALAVIEAEASRTLYEMRTMVRVLRDGDTVDAAPVEYGPPRGISDLDELTRMSPVVQVHCSGDLAGLPQPVEGAERDCGAISRRCEQSPWLQHCKFIVSRGFPACASLPDVRRLFCFVPCRENCCRHRGGAGDRGAGGRGVARGRVRGGRVRPRRDRGRGRGGRVVARRRGPGGGTGR